ncbi:MAG: hypothetical protein WA421_09195 [Nitrososphaeraceae archaeon]
MPKLQKLSIAKLGGKKRGIKEWQSKKPLHLLSIDSAHPSLYEPIRFRYAQLMANQNINVKWFRVHDPLPDHRKFAFVCFH